MDLFPTTIKQRNSHDSMTHFPSTTSLLREGDERAKRDSRDIIGAKALSLLTVAKLDSIPFTTYGAVSTARCHFWAQHWDSCQGGLLSTEHHQVLNIHWITIKLVNMRHFGVSFSSNRNTWLGSNLMPTWETSLSREQQNKTDHPLCLFSSLCLTQK